MADEAISCSTLMRLVLNPRLVSKETTGSSTLPYSSSSSSSSLPESATRTTSSSLRTVDKFDVSTIPINNSQQTAVSNLRPGLDVIHGPPGTGKSTTIWHIINSRLQPRASCLVTCSRNQAVDAIVEKIADFGVLVFGRDDRLGSHSKMYTLKGRVETDEQVIYWTGVFDRIDSFKKSIVDAFDIHWKLLRLKLPGINTLKFKSKETADGYRNGAKLWSIVLNSVLLENARERIRKQSGGVRIRLWSNLLKTSTKFLIDVVTRVRQLRSKYIMENTRIHVCTIDSTVRMQRSLQLHEIDLKLDTCIVDEAGCVLESCIPTLLAFSPKNLILIGDHKQLQPFSAIHHDFGNNAINNAQSLLERCIKCDLKPWLLTVQYRMHPEICSLVSRLFYDNQLTTDSGLKRDLPSVSASGNTETPCRWIDVSSSEVSHPRRGYSNPAEAAAAIACAELLVRNHPGKTVYIITFYNRQRGEILDKIKINSCLAPLIDKTVFALSIDACQGSEADFVILSTVRTDDVGKFMEEPRRLCVALSRAKFGCVIVGHLRNMKNKSRKFWLSIGTHYNKSS